MKNKLGVLMIVAILATTYACGSKKTEESATSTSADTTKVAADSTSAKADTTKAK